MNSTARLTGVSPNTVAKLLENVGAECNVYLHFNMVKLPCTRIQVDEIWSFCRMKEKRVPSHLKGQLGFGDTYAWIALDPDSKIVPCFLVGRRGTESAKEFMDDLAWRLSNRIQLTSDGHVPYLEAVEGAFGGKVDFARQVKHYGGVKVYRDGTRKKCRRSECSGITREVVCGNPDPDHISTSLIERQNLSLRMGLRRLTRETNGFSKKLANHRAALGLYFMYYNFVRIHKTLRVTPAQEAGIENRLWSIEDLVRLVD